MDFAVIVEQCSFFPANNLNSCGGLILTVNGQELLEAYRAGRTAFQEVDLTGADLAWAMLSDVDLSGSNLSRVNFSGATLHRVKLNDGANLAFANLSRSDLNQVDLSSANLEGANLEGTAFSNIVFNEATKWPRGFQPPPSAKSVGPANSKPADAPAPSPPAPAISPKQYEKAIAQTLDQQRSVAQRAKRLQEQAQRDAFWAQRDGQKSTIDDHEATLEVEWVEASPPAPKVSPKLQPSQQWQQLYELKGHRAPINAIAVSTDNHWLASASDDCTVNLWDFQTGRYVFSFLGQSQAATSVAISADGQFIASSSWDGKVTIWRLPQRTLLRTLMERGTVTSHQGPVYAIAFSPDSKKLITAGADHCIKIWGIETGNVLQTLKYHTDEVRAIALSSDGRWLVAGSADKTVTICRPRPLSGPSVLRGKHLAAIQAVAISANNQTVISAASDGTINTWDIKAAVLKQSWSAHPPGPIAIPKAGQFKPLGLQATALAPHPTQPLIASAANDGIIQIWDIESGSLVQVLEGNGPIAFSHDGKTLIAQSQQYSLNILRDITVTPT